MRQHANHLAVLFIAALTCCAATQSSAVVISRTIYPSMSRGSNSTDTLLVSIYPCGQLDAAGRNIAVVDADGKPVPYRPLMIHADAETVIAVDTRDTRSPLTLRYGTSGVDGAKVDDRVPVSLVMRVFPLNGKPNSLDAADKLIDARRAIGVVSLDKLLQGNNPVGPDVNFLAEYLGEFKMKGPGTYRLFAVADDMGFVQVDGNTLFNITKANVQRDGNKIDKTAKPTKLAMGPHTLRFVQVQFADEAWATFGYTEKWYSPKEPEKYLGMRPWVIDAKQWTHHAEARLGDATASDKSVPAAFDARQIDRLEYGKNLFSRFTLRAITPAPKGAHWQWSFSDGTTAKGDELEHVFFGNHGPWKVTLQLIGAGDSKPATASVRPITMGKDAFVTPEDPENEQTLEAYVNAMVMADYDRAPREVLEATYEVVASSHHQSQMVHIAEPYVKQFGGSGALGESMRYLIASHMAGRDPKVASTMFLELAREGSDPWLRARAAAEHLDLLMYSLGETKRLEGVIRMFMARVDPRGKALLWSRLGDVYRFEGDSRQAQQAYERAQRLSNMQLNRQQADVLMRAHREAAITYMNADNNPGLRDELFKWEADFPLAKLSGDLPLYTGRYYQGIGNLPRAAIEYVTLLKNNPLHPQRPEIVFRLGQCLASLNKPAEAKPWLKEVVDKYPNSPYHEPASELLATLN